ncbi:VIT and vWA domain-containing protein [Enhygromyxa salina]|uniref:Vault protein inter-alpha-trypsin n=1 Tax=Enhygromyxa salina TaxID=215803 RepID=A0A2S9YC73_9BACT|nr:VIT and VWA domain-containing protein [Enhygromyxa salina]PRQ02714.1 Vault protein inter-alpha-trypsin [Enhygromyxa salina]
MRRSRTPLLLSVVLLAACASPTTSSNTTTSAAQPALGAKTDVARTSAWLADMDRGADQFGPGQLEVQDPAAADASTFLELDSLSVNVDTIGPMARYEVEHVFHNGTDQVLEGTFRFPLPAGSIVTGLAMEIDGELLDGEILERERARKIYQDIVDSMRDPALLEWEAGQTFKLRVFPIQAGERKRVVMRYMAPLQPSDDAPSGFAVAIPSAAPAMQTSIPALTVRVDGREVLQRKNHSARENLSVALDRASAPAYVEESSGEQMYLAARLDLDWARVANPVTQIDQRRTVIVVDSSRSALESWALAREAVAAVLAGLGPDDEFMLVTGDLETRVFSDDFVRNDPDQRAAALAFLTTIEPDGASDLGAMITRVGAALRTPSVGDQVVYVGDGTPTWGTTDRERLVEQATAALDGAPLYALSVGKRESRDTLEALTGSTGGRTLRPQSVPQVQAFSAFLERAPQVRRVAKLELEVPGVEQVHAPLRTTLFEGERPVVHFRVAKGAPIPTQVTVRGWAGGLRFEQVVELGEPLAQVGVRQQWAARELAATTDKATAVALSVEHSVLSKHTALLVLESEEAYERYDIERRNGPAANQPAGETPEVSGRNLDADGGSPYLGPGDLQPGDPEIHIPAPRDAQSVDVVFPFGETKTARWEHELGQWTVRFLVDDDTEPGTYEVLVRVTHADGRVELLNLEYTIDVEAPQLRLELKIRDDGAYDVYAHQLLSEADAARERVEGRRGDEQASTLDARRVELIMPDGQTLSLRLGMDGHFVRRWAPRGEVQWPATVTAVVADRALNSRRVELSLEGPS